MNCCAHYPLGKFPFLMVDETDYYDGPVMGIIKCPHCLRMFRFDMIDWSKNHDIRIFSLSVLASRYVTEYEHKIELFAKNSSLQQSNSEEQYQLLNNILDNAEPPSLIIVWDIANDLLLAMKGVNEEIRPYIHPLLSNKLDDLSIDWFEYLHVPRS
jgi:hypothetical protein